MARLVIQSGETWCFLHAHPRTNDVCWTPSLRDAIRFGLIRDEAHAQQLIEDHCDQQAARVVDLDEEEAE